MSSSISIIICTRNRATDLRHTLEGFGTINPPAGMPVELIVVDNGSTDRTPDVVREMKLPWLIMRYVFEPRKGKGFAYNAALAAATGEILVFTDDDVRPPQNWIEGMAKPILSGHAEAVLGAIKMAPHLEREWMTPYHRSWFCTDTLMQPGVPLGLIGANMAFARSILKKVPAFDVELGPGRLGFREDSLLSAQLEQAGYRLAAVTNVVVEHHFDPDRLSRRSLLHRVKCEGHSSAYIAYHWQHDVISRQRCEEVIRDRRWKLIRTRLKAIIKGRANAIPTEAEMRLTQELAFHQQYLVESVRPRNYERFGLVKIAGEGAKPIGGRA